MRRSVATVVVTLLVAVLATACSGSDPTGERGPAAVGARLGFPSGTTGAQRGAALAALRRRLTRAGIAATVRVSGSSLVVRPDPGPYVLEALARRAPTYLTTVTATTPAPCAGAAVASVRAAGACSQLDPDAITTQAVATTRVRASALDGYGVDVTVAGARWPAWRDAMQVRRPGPVAIVAGDRVLATARLSAPALRTRIAGQLTRADARRVAAALLVDTPLPIALDAPATPAIDGPTTHDVWNTSLAVRVCGQWLGPAPSFTTETGIHSHGDGYVYLHSLARADVGKRPRLGDFVRIGGWTMNADRLDLWDHVRHDAEHPCPGSGRAVIRWTVNGVEQRGSPSALALAPAQVVVIQFGPPAEPVAVAPADAGLLATRWTASPSR